MDRLVLLEILEHREVKALQDPEVNPVQQGQLDQRALWETRVRVDLSDQPDQLGTLDRSEPLVIRDLPDQLELEVRLVQGLPLPRERADLLDLLDQLGQQDNLDQVVSRDPSVLLASQDNLEGQDQRVKTDPLDLLDFQAFQVSRARLDPADLPVH